MKTGYLHVAIALKAIRGNKLTKPKRCCGKNAKTIAAYNMQGKYYACTSVC